MIQADRYFVPRPCSHKVAGSLGKQKALSWEVGIGRETQVHRSCVLSCNYCLFPFRFSTGKDSRGPQIPTPKAKRTQLSAQIQKSCRHGSLSPHVKFSQNSTSGTLPSECPRTPQSCPGHTPLGFVRLFRKISFPH